MLVIKWRWLDDGSIAGWRAISQGQEVEGHDCLVWEGDEMGDAGVNGSKGGEGDKWLRGTVWGA